MQCALTWIAQCAWMRALMNLPNFVELARLLLNGQQGQLFSLLTANSYTFGFIEFSYLIFHLDISRAMSGSVPFEDALAARLSLFNPSLSQVQEFLEKRPPR